MVDRHADGREPGKNPDADPVPTEEAFERGGIPEVIREGLVGGFVATCVMTLYRFPVFRALPPTAKFWAMYVQSGEPEEFVPEGAFLHALYGSVGGVAFGLLYTYLVSHVDADDRLLGVAGGLIFGGLLSLVGTRLVLAKLLDESLNEEERLVFHVGHLIYGLSLGTWMSTRQHRDEVYD